MRCGFAAFASAVAIALSLTTAAASVAAAGEPEATATGTLVLVGGGRFPEEARRVFIEHAGGEQARIVVIPTASLDAEEEPESFLEPWEGRGLARVALLHTRDRAEADDARFCAPLRSGTGAWMSGGDQARLIATYAGTRVHRELRALLRRGGVVGGTSAGAAAASDVMIRRGTEEPELGPGLGLLRGAIVDQHFLVRDRLRRLRRAVERSPGRYGLGIDESTALVIRGGEARVMGPSAVIFLPPRRAGEVEDPPRRWESGARFVLPQGE